MAARHMMVVGAHISDAENMAGAVMLKHKKAGWDITIVHMTAGEKGHPTLPPEEYIKMRHTDAQASAAFVGANVEILPYQDAELRVTEEAAWMVADLIRKYRPNVIITHWNGSFHPDHNNTHEIVRQSLFKASLPAFRRENPPHSIQTLLYSENREDMQNYSADIYLDVSDVFEDYLSLLKTHALMREKYSNFRYYDYYEALGTVRGALAGFDKAVTLMRPPSMYSYDRESGLLLT
jgi:LmbE family N-acetylglucosaminyl deacetylase